MPHCIKYLNDIKRTLSMTHMSSGCTFCLNSRFYFFILLWGRRGHDRIVVGFITTYAIGAYHH